MSLLKQMKKVFPFQVGDETTVEVGAYQRVLRRDYRLPNGSHDVRIGVSLHHPDSDEPMDGGVIAGHILLEKMLAEASVSDGDEFEILVTKTGVRPHGDRLWIKDGFRYRPETDDECLTRIEQQD